MKTIQLQIGITLDDDGLKTLAGIFQQVSDSMPKKMTPHEKMTPQELSQHALFRGQKPPEDRGLLINSREAAKLLQVSDRTLWKMQSTGQSPKPIRIGRGVRWSLEELKAWVRSGCPPREKWNFDWKKLSETR